MCLSPAHPAHRSTGQDAVALCCSLIDGARECHVSALRPGIAQVDIDARSGMVVLVSPI